MNQHAIAARLLSIRDVAQVLQVSPRTVEVLITKGEAPQPIRIGRQRRWAVQDIDAWIELLRGKATDPSIGVIEPVSY